MAIEEERMHGGSWYNGRKLGLRALESGKKGVYWFIGVEV